MRRHWVVIDGRGIRKPWASGSPQMSWSDVRDVVWSNGWGLRLLGSRRQKKLRISWDLDGFDELLQQILQNIPLGECTPPWCFARWAHAVEATSDKLLRIRTRTAAIEFPISDVRRVSFIIDANSTFAPIVERSDGSCLLVPPIFGENPIRILRALSQLVPSAAQGSQGAGVEADHRTSASVVARASRSEPPRVAATPVDRSRRRETLRAFGWILLILVLGVALRVWSHGALMR